MTTTFGDFRGDRLRVARTMEGLTLAALGKKVSASASLLSLIENGRKVPGKDLWRAVAEVLSFDAEFFAIPLPDEVREDQCNWRSLSSAPVSLRKRVAARATLFAEAVQYLSRNLALPAYSIPRLRAQSSESIENAAEKCRELWGLGVDRPIGLMNRVLENHGVVLTQLDADSTKVDAFSRPGSVNIVVLNTNKRSASRARFDMAHELGHFVLHADGYGSVNKEEDANKFAAAFLLPRNQFTREFWKRRVVDWALIFELKRRWKVSAAAIVHRAYQLDLIDAASYRIAYRFLYRRNWHRGEPEEPAYENPELFGIALKKLEISKGESPHDVCRALGWSAKKFSDITGVAVVVPRPDLNGVVSLDSYRAKKKAVG